MVKAKLLVDARPEVNFNHEVPPLCFRPLAFPPTPSGSAPLPRLPCPAMPCSAMPCHAMPCFDLALLWSNCLGLSTLANACYPLLLSATSCHSLPPPPSGCNCFTAHILPAPQQLPAILPPPSSRLAHTARLLQQQQLHLPAVKKQRTVYSAFRMEVARLHQNLHEFEQDLNDYSRQVTGIRARGGQSDGWQAGWSWLELGCG